MPPTTSKIIDSNHNASNQYNKTVFKSRENKNESDSKWEGRGEGK